MPGPRFCLAEDVRFLLHSHIFRTNAMAMQAVAQGLRDLGHPVVWLAPEEHRSIVLEAGATFVPTTALAVIDAPLRERHMSGVFDTEKGALVHGRRLLAQVDDYRGVLKDFQPHVLVVDAFPYGAQALWELREIPCYATLGSIPLYVSHSKCPLPSSGDQPPQGFLDTMINRLRHMYRRYVQMPRDLAPLLNAQRLSLGLPRLPFAQPVERYSYSPFLHIQASTPDLEFLQVPAPGKHIKKTIHCGPLIRYDGISHADRVMPHWWNEVFDPERLVVGVTQSTDAPDPISVIVPAIEALAGNPHILLIVMSPFIARIKSRVGHRRQGVRYSGDLQYYVVFPHLRLLITDGVYSSVTMGLAAALPILCAGQEEEKKDAAARVTWWGAGVDLGTSTPTAVQIMEGINIINNNILYEHRAMYLRVESTSNFWGYQQAVCELRQLAASSVYAGDNTIRHQTL